MTYTPTTDEVRDEWIESGQGSPTVRLHAGAAFDRWLAAHDRDVRAQALREAADVLDRQPAKAKHGLPMMLRADWLRDRANRIEQGGQP